MLRIIPKKSVIIMLGLPLLAFACGKDRNKTTKAGAKVRETPTDLRGAWLSPCMSSALPGIPHIQRQYIFNAIGDFDKVERYYNDKDCKVLGATYKSIGTVDTTSPLTEDESVRTMNLTMNDAFITIHNADTTTLFNTLKICDRSDWVADSEKSVIGLSCAGVKAKKGDVIFDVYSKKEGNIYFGQTSLFLVRDSGDERPRTINEEVPYTKM